MTLPGDGCTDITYIPMRRGFLYLVAVMDWHSRQVLSWRLSNTMDAGFCIEALKEALARYGPPEIFNSPSRDISCGNTLPGNGSGLAIYQHRFHRRAARRQGKNLPSRACSHALPGSGWTGAAAGSPLMVCK